MVRPCSRKICCRYQWTTDIVITKIDVLSGLDTAKICVAYDIDGKRYTSVPASTEILSRAIPV